MSSGVGETRETAKKGRYLTGAFALTEGSRDAALIANVPPGAYTAEVTSTTVGQSGGVIMEVYELP